MKEVSTSIMHCDYKRTLFVLKEQIEKRWDELKNSGFKDERLLKNLNEAFVEYFEYKKSSN